MLSRAESGGPAGILCQMEAHCAYGTGYCPMLSFQGHGPLCHDRVATCLLCWLPAEVRNQAVSRWVGEERAPSLCSAL
eukprot:scaffold7377_cov389-Prasinococcus_capsulatus_cf.AAC.33